LNCLACAVFKVRGRRAQRNKLQELTRWVVPQNSTA
jgi:hypothetical protein